MVSIFSHVKQRLERAWAAQASAADVEGEEEGGEGGGLLGKDVVTMLGFASDGRVRGVIGDSSSSGSSSSSSSSSSITHDRLVLPSRTIGFMGYIAHASAARSLLATILPLSQAQPPHFTAAQT